nr:alpha/beta fold hydrolase [Brevibacterium daeguense]
MTSVTSGRPTGPVIALFLHGFGSNEHDLTGLAPVLPDGVEWASLRAPFDAGNGGAAWFPITTPGLPDAAPVEAATAQIWAWVDSQLAPETRVVPVGFSQGGLMASQLLRTRPDRVAGTAVLSGFVLQHPQPADAELEDLRPQVFWGRGDADRVISPAAVQRTAAWLPAHSTLTSRVYPGLAHGISAEEAGDLAAFLRTALDTEVPA